MKKFAALVLALAAMALALAGCGRTEDGRVSDPPHSPAAVTAPHTA